MCSVYGVSSALLMCGWLVSVVFSISSQIKKWFCQTTWKLCDASSKISTRNNNAHARQQSNRYVCTCTKDIYSKNWKQKVNGISLEIEAAKKCPNKMSSVPLLLLKLCNTFWFRLRSCLLVCACVGMRLQYFCSFPFIKYFCDSFDIPLWCAQCWYIRFLWNISCQLFLRAFDCECDFFSKWCLKISNTMKVNESGLFFISTSSDSIRL